MHGCFNLNALVTNFASSSLAILPLLFVPSATMLVFAGRVSVLQFMTFCFFGISLDDLHVVQTVSFIHIFTELQSVFSDRTTNLSAHSWRSQIVPDHLYLDETELIQTLLPNKYDKSCRSFRDGAGPCNQRFGNRNVCHGLSFDLSFVLSSICHSWDLMLEIHP